VCDSPESKMTLGVLSKRVVRWLIDVVPGRNIRDLDQSELEYKEASLYFNLFSSTNFYLLTTHREKESPRNNRI
jgi:hypothetical protein